MNAEERLKELYERIEHHGKLVAEGCVKTAYTSLMPKDIDLIADLVVERLKNNV